MATRKATATATRTKAAATKTVLAPKKRPAKSGAAEKEVTIDRRRKADRREEETKVEAPLEKRAKVQRRRQIDPTTCERDYAPQEVEFMNALDDYKRKNGRMFPTCSEVLEVIRGLGYVQLSPAEMAARDGMNAAAFEAANEPDPTKAFATAAEMHLVL